MCLCLCRGRGVYWPSPCTIHIQVSDTWTDFLDTFFDIFISMSTDWTSISKECYGQICWGKPDTTGYGNGSTDLPGTYYSSDAPLHCPLSNMLTQSPLLPSYNVHVLGHTWFNLFSILSKTRSQHSDGAYELQLLFSISDFKAAWSKFFNNKAESNNFSWRQLLLKNYKLFTK